MGRRVGKDWPLSSVGWMTQVDETGGADRTAEADIELRQRAVEAGAECAQHREPIEVRSRRYQEERRQYSGAADGSSNSRDRCDQGEDEEAATGA